MVIIAGDVHDIKQQGGEFPALLLYLWVKADHWVDCGPKPGSTVLENDAANDWLGSSRM